MEPTRFRKLDTDLPVEPITNDRPWAIAGLLCGLAFVIVIAFAFLRYKGIF
ncbi:MAG: hypothetical protein ACR2KZ_07645 [Segetibacter sp.]